MSEIIKAEITDLVQDDRNGNKGTERGSKMLEQSIKDCGMGRSVLVDRNGRLIGGNKTQQAAIANGVKEVIVVRTDGTQLVAVQRTDLDLDEPKARKLAWIDNRISEVNYDPDLDRLLEDINNGIDLSFYYERTELDEMIDQMCAEQARSGEGAPSGETELDCRVQFGEVWQVGNQVIICGDCRDKNTWERLLGKKKVDLCFTSPPYASQRKYDEESEFEPIHPDNYVDWFNPIASNVKSYLSKTGSFFINIKEHCDDGQRSLYVSDLKIAFVRWWGWKWIDELIWYKNGFPGHWDNRLRDDFERVFHFAVGKPQMYADAIAIPSEGSYKFHSDYSGDTQGSGSDREYKEKTIDKALPGNVIKVGVETSQSGHPAAFPEGLAQFFVKGFSKPGDVICDPFCGSGTTLVVAQSCDRAGFGFEVSPKYCDIVLNRLEGLTGDSAKRL